MDSPHLIAKHFFHPSRASQSVRLNVNGELLNDLGRVHGFSSKDFATHAASGLSTVPKQTDNVCEYAEELLDRWRAGGKSLRGTVEDFPPFIGYLAVFVYIGALGDDAELRCHRRLWSFFPRANSLGFADDVSGFDRMKSLWEALESWSRKTHGGQLGVFRLLKLGAYPHVSIPWAQAIMTDEERARLPGLFASSGLTPQSPVPQARLKQIVSDFGGAS